MTLRSHTAVSPTPFTLVPVLAHIMLFLPDAAAVARLRRVSTFWRWVIDGESIWRDRCVREGIAIDHRPASRSWQWFYRAETVRLPDVVVPSTVSVGYVLSRVNRQSGEWVGRHLHGVGWRALADGGSMVGLFRSGMFVHGRRTYENGDYFEGHFHGTGRRSFGTYVWANRDRFTGEWCECDGKMDGFGRYEWSDGRRYVGLWTENFQAIWGRYWWPDGAEYRGGWTCGRRHGWGLMLWADGTRYEGPFDDDARGQTAGDPRRVAIESKPWDNFFRLDCEDTRRAVKRWRERNDRAVLRVSEFLATQPLVIECK